jgi:transmembrane sensor
MSAAHDIQSKAASYLVRRDGEAWTSDDQVELDTWLQEDLKHHLAWVRLQGAWSRADRLSSLRSPAGPAVSHYRRPQPWARWGAIAAGVILVLSAGVGGAYRLANGPRIYSTELGGREVVPLSDGTQVQLNTNTKVRAAVTAGARDVWLERGEAYFEVAHDPAHPFRVHAGDRVVTVLGTKFSVRREGDDVRVIPA